jgi:hypothetical protein
LVNHRFDSIKHLLILPRKFRLGDYEDLKPYVDKVVAGQETFSGKKPLYFAKTSGTTSGQNTFR